MNTGHNTAGNWKIYALILAVLYCLVYILPLGERAIMIPDEARYAEIPREMIISGDWVSPQLNDLRYFEKPVFGYWLTAISMQLFGDNAFAMRLPSALSAGLSAFAVFLLLHRFARRPGTALTGAMIYLSMLGVYLIGTVNILDSVFSFLLTAAFVSFYFSHRENSPGKRLLQLILLGIFCGMAFLAKGFLAFALLGSVIGLYVILQGRWQELFSRGWIALLAALAVIAPWAIMVHLQEPEYWHYFFWEEHVKRFASEEAQHDEPFWFYLMYLPLLALPWIAQLPLALKSLLKNDESKQLALYAVFWCLLPFVFFSVARGKLPTYVLPCLAPLSVMLAIGMENYLANKKITAFKISSGITALVFLLISVLLVLMQNGVVGKPVWYENESWKWIALAISFLVASLLFVFSLRAQSTGGRLSLQAMSVVGLMLVLAFALPQRTAESKMPGEFLLEHADKIRPDTIIMSDDIMIHAVNWFYKRTDVYMTGAGESKHGLSFADSSHRLIEGKALKQFIRQHINKDAMVVIHHSDADDFMRSIMPAQAQHFRWGKFVLWYMPVKTRGRV